MKGKTRKPLGFIQVDVVVGTTTRPTLFVVILTKVIYNLLLGRECIRGVGCVASSMHIESDQSFFCAEVNHVDRRNFDQRMVNISPCATARSSFDFKGGDVYYFIKLHPLHGYMWEHETIEGYNKWSGVGEDDV